VIIKNDQLLAFIGLLLTFNLSTQIAKGFAVYYFKNVCGNEYLYSIFGFAIIQVQAAGTITGIRVLMILIPIGLAVFSFFVYHRFYTLKGEKMAEVTRRINEIHARNQ